VGFRASVGDCVGRLATFSASPRRFWRLLCLAASAAARPIFDDPLVLGAPQRPCRIVVYSSLPVSAGTTVRMLEASFSAYAE
jgi:hypothetical protein